MYINESGFYVANDEDKRTDDDLYADYDKLRGELDATRYLIRRLTAQLKTAPEETKEIISKQLKELRNTRDALTNELTF